MIIVAFVWISQVVILRLHDVIPITRVISRRVSIARSVQYHILRDDHAYFHDITLHTGAYLLEARTPTPTPTPTSRPRLASAQRLSGSCDPDP